MDIGVFIPIANNGWLFSTSSPQYMPTFELNKQIVQKAEGYGLDFALSMIKFKGFGGETDYWRYALDSFTLMAGLAAVTERIKVIASAPILAFNPALVARMANTIDSIAPGRVGVNMVTGLFAHEYTQMGLWPGDSHFESRYRRASEYATILHQLWSTGRSDFSGEFYQMEDCEVLPRPTDGKVELVVAGQSDTGLAFAAEYADYNFITGQGVNAPGLVRETIERLAVAAESAGRDVGALPLYMVIAAETDEEARERWLDYHAHADRAVIESMFAGAQKDSSGDEKSTARTTVVSATAVDDAGNLIEVPEGAINWNMGTFVGSYETVARMLDEVAEIPGTRGIMLVFDDFIRGMDDFGQRIQPLMRSRRDRASADA